MKGQWELQKQILGRYRQLGIVGQLPAFQGNMPVGIKALKQDANISVQGATVGLSSLSNTKACTLAGSNWSVHSRHGTALLKYSWDLVLPKSDQGMLVCLGRAGWTRWTRCMPRSQTCGCELLSMISAPTTGTSLMGISTAAPRPGWMRAASSSLLRYEPVRF